MEEQFYQKEDGQKNKKLVALAVLIIVVLAIVAVAFRFTEFSKNKAIVSEQASNLQQLYRAGNSCQEIITLADEYLKDSKKDLNILIIKGHCQFELEKYSEAKTTFEKIVDLDSKNETAKIYLDNIDKALNGFVIFIDPEKDALTKSYVGDKLGFDLEKAGFTFYSATSLNKEGDTHEKFGASYIAEEASIKKVSSAVENLLDKNNINYQKFERDGSIYYEVRLTEEGPFLGYSISVVDMQPIDISIFYEY